MSAQQPQILANPAPRAFGGETGRALIRRDFLLGIVRFPPFDNPVGG
jgi:hypothetical protein